MESKKAIAFEQAWHWIHGPFVSCQAFCNKRERGEARRGEAREGSEGAAAALNEREQTCAYVCTHFPGSGGGVVVATTSINDYQDALKGSIWGGGREKLSLIIDVRSTCSSTGCLINGKKKMKMKTRALSGVRALVDLSREGEVEMGVSLCWMP